MKGVIQNINDITDSREMLEAKPHPFTIIFMYILIALLGAALIWSYFGEIDIVVKAKGIVRPNDKISTIKNVVSGKIKTINMKESSFVKKGDILYSLNTEAIDLKLEQTEELYRKSKIEYNNLCKFRESIFKKKNLFDLNNELERDYYYKYEKYKMDVEEEAHNKELINKKVVELKSKIDNEELLLKSINDNVNYFDKKDNNEYYYMYEGYRIKKDELEKKVNFTENNYKRYKELFESGSISKKEFEDIENYYEEAKMSLEKFKNENISKLSNDILQNKLLLSQTIIEKNKLFRSAKVKEQGNFTYLETDTIVSLDELIKKKEVEIQDINLKLNELKENKKQCIIKAPIDGILKIQKELNVGDNVIGGEDIATIIPKKQNEFKVKIYVENKDISNIKVGDTVKYHFKALPFKEYGELKGKISNIASDASFDENSGLSYFVEGSLENKPVYGYKGDVKKVKVGMTADVYIVTKRKKILHYILEKLDLRS
ncbi:HlyD family efflux transporter periplasmic adaptor subunit [Tepidibacter thalassicus]|uniref:HlyD family secretion protein n=1 Tax=Tepidibacter thalassicus DSM 15285 TaxID=1123350 RepID=A0A1M5QU90_9FIRM|nr:HlyD family efflux transporter periplasmic adaptor subunit [Tepidibacter thalassicus]SHH17714.1 HlyD family secretion protein [Tepidibacter thalassicus DSM 15285]